MKNRAALYARVSTARQEQEKTIGSQVEAIERACAAGGVSIAPDRRYVDEGFSGSRLDRPAFDALRDAAADGLIDVIYIYCPDRLARSYVHQQVILEELTKRGVRVHFVEHPVGERAEDRLLVQMQGVIAEYERAKILERTRRGRMHKVREGRMLPFGIPPYGYAIVRTKAVPGGSIVIDEVEAQNVRAMYRWVLDEGLSARQVAKRLNALGIKPRRAKIWVAGSVHVILTNAAYTGMATYGKREPAEPKRPRRPGGYRKNAKSSHVIRPRAQWLHVSIPSLVTEKDQECVRTRLAKNKIWAPRNVQHDYLLRALVTCGECGWKMACGHQSSVCKRYEYFYYECARRDPVDTGRMSKCTAKRVRAEELDGVVWDAIRSWVQSPAMLQRELELWRTSRQAASSVAKELARLEGARRQLELQVERLIDAYQRGAISVEQLKSRRERLDSAMDSVSLRGEDLIGQQMDSTRVTRIADDLAAFASTLRKGFDKLDFTERQRIVRLLLERVVVTGDKLTIEHAIPLSGRFGGLRQGDRARLRRSEDRHAGSPRGDSQQDGERRDAGALGHRTRVQPRASRDGANRRGSLGAAVANQLRDEPSPHSRRVGLGGGGACSGCHPEKPTSASRGAEALRLTSTTHGASLSPRREDQDEQLRS
ncbi:recombinase family protein [Pendulispora albinea]|uniref:Recombinase family protein n=1 Tax=Pendulispora albinea TaxID=2741071 RepID=A0ABZ2MA93_9BACT